MEYNEIIAAFNKKQYSPIYFLMGEEHYFIDKLSTYIETHFFTDESAKDFDLEILYGQDVSVNQIAIVAKQYPMTSTHRLVIVREAQEVGKITQLAEYMKNPQPQTILVLCYKEAKFAANTEMYKAMNKNGVIFQAKKVYEDHLPKYVREFAKEKNLKMSDSAVNMLVSNIGVNLYRIDHELEKLINIVAPGEEITPQIIENFIGISREYNVFEYVSAVVTRNYERANRILHYFSNNPKNFEKGTAIPNLYLAFFRLMQYHFSVDKSEMFMKSLGVFWKDARPYMQAASYYSFARIVNIMHLLRKYDMMNKGWGGNQTEEPELLKELTFQIFKS
ncbi:MAG: DNA polymerase III subunit delta [Bacteroidales bacterium]|jgi:DNA polymerase-3 subunit delta|nr:DNA polymerase III subunit delta [Bacteroidales bacterium]